MSSWPPGEPVSLASEEGGSHGRAGIRRATEDAIRLMARRDPGPLSDEMRLVADLGFDSLRIIELAIVIEQRVGLPPVPLDSSLTVSTVKDVFDMVERISSGGTR